MDAEQGQSYYPLELKNQQPRPINLLDVSNPFKVCKKAVTHIISTDFDNYLVTKEGCLLLFTNKETNQGTASCSQLLTLNQLVYRRAEKQENYHLFDVSLRPDVNILFNPPSKPVM